MDLNTKGSFVISLDFELLWGLRDKRSINSYGKNLIGTWETLPKTLNLFTNYKICATFATVGFLFADNKRQLLTYCPYVKPAYNDANLSPYNGHFDLVKKDEDEDHYHFASSLLDMIQEYPEHEISTHTFSHYYCNEKGQNIRAFEEDLKAAIEIGKLKQVKLKSIVFPRNQVNTEYLPILAKHDINLYRGNLSYFFDSYPELIKKILRTADSYLNITGHNTFAYEIIKSCGLPYNLPASKFLRPYSEKFKFLEKMKIRRIKNSMTYAAKNNNIYHLWWHPHNFGIHPNENLQMLEEVLKHYTYLNTQYGFTSRTMQEFIEL